MYIPSMDKDQIEDVLRFPRCTSFVWFAKGNTEVEAEQWLNEAVAQVAEEHGIAAPPIVIETIEYNGKYGELANWEITFRQAL